MDASLDLIIGPMFCGKTAELLRRLDIYSAMGMTVAYLNCDLDDRSDEIFSTHSKILKNLGNICGAKIDRDLSTTNMSLRVKNAEIYTLLKDCDIIGIDEGQFFTNLNIVLDWVEIYSKKVIIAGLSSNYKRQKFGEILDLIPVCDQITKLHSFCDQCWKRDKILVPAPFTYMHTDIPDCNIKVGNEDIYKPECRKCYYAHQSKE